MSEEQPMQACTCQSDMAAFAKRYQSRKAKMETLLKRLNSKFSYSDMTSALEVLTEQVFDEP